VLASCDPTLATTVVAIAGMESRRDVRRHRVISISYISLLPCHGSTLAFTFPHVGTPLDLTETDTVRRVIVGQSPRTCVWSGFQMQVI
jgi:hypothetical protein